MKKPADGKLHCFQRGIYLDSDGPLFKIHFLLFLPKHILPLICQSMQYFFKHFFCIFNCIVPVLCTQ